jgi:NADPH:quinone reductase
MQNGVDYIHCSRPGGAEVLEYTHGPRPEPGPHEVLIRVATAGVNRPDIFQRQGLYPPPPGASAVLGLEVAGEISAIGANVSRWRPGDKVCALVNGGGYASYALAPADQCLPVPDGLTFEQAAALPEACFTVWHNLWQRVRLQKDERLLVHGGSGGIGTTAIQMARAWGVDVYATAGSEAKCQACERLGAKTIHYRQQDFVAEIKAATNGRGVDVILDMVGGDYVQRNFSAASREGRIVNIAFLKGSKVTLDLLPVMVKRLSLTGSTLRAQSVEVKASIARELHTHIWPLIERGRIVPVLAASFPLERAADAHRLMESGEHIGKIILNT